jgi:hypothetical protein
MPSMNCSGHIVLLLRPLVCLHRVKVHPRSRRLGRTRITSSTPLAKSSLQQHPLPHRHPSQSESAKRVRRCLSTSAERHIPLSRFQQLTPVSCYAKDGVDLGASISPASRHAKLNRCRRRNARVADRVGTPSPHPPLNPPCPPPAPDRHLPVYPLRLHYLLMPHYLPLARQRAALSMTNPATITDGSGRRRVPTASFGAASGRHPHSIGRVHSEPRNVRQHSEKRMPVRFLGTGQRSVNTVMNSRIPIPTRTGRGKISNARAFPVALGTRIHNTSRLIQCRLRGRNGHRRCLHPRPLTICAHLVYCPIQIRTPVMSSQMPPPPLLAESENFDDEADGGESDDGDLPVTPENVPGPEPNADAGLESEDNELPLSGSSTKYLPTLWKPSPFAFAARRWASQDGGSRQSEHDRERSQFFRTSKRAEQTFSTPRRGPTADWGAGIATNVSPGVSDASRTPGAGARGGSAGGGIARTEWVQMNGTAEEFGRWDPYGDSASSSEEEVC